MAEAETAVPLPPPGPEDEDGMGAFSFAALGGDQCPSTPVGERGKTRQDLAASPTYDAGHWRWAGRMGDAARAGPLS